MKQGQDWRSARVADVRQIARDIRRLVFDVDGGAPAFDAGSHLAIRVGLGAGAALRSYTCVPCDAGQLAIAVKLHPRSRGGSRYIWSLGVGDRVQLRMPENHFPLAWNAPEYVLLAGGVGITPLFGMAQALAARGAQVQLHYGAEDEQAMAYRVELATLLGDRARFYADAQAQRPDLPSIIAAMHSDALMYVCGPLPMLNAAKAAWAQAGRPHSRLRYEVFGDTGAHPEQAFRVRVQGLDRDVSVAADQSLLAALQAAGIDMIYDCQRGECGLCAVRLVQTDAQIDHRDVFFSATEKAQNHHMCACVSRLVGGCAVIDIGYRG